tara:strand:+ start:486 stop:896 length:411 start_codon:yes stop_codon:yes gene_type:complete
VTEEKKPLNPLVLRFTTTSMAPELDIIRNGALLVNKFGARIDAAPEQLGPRIAEQPDKTGYVVLDSALASKYSAWPDFIATAPGVAYAYFDDFRRTRPDIFSGLRVLPTLQKTWIWKYQSSERLFHSIMPTSHRVL